jgi:hypothetical protein
MPTYTFIDKETGVEKDHIMSYKDLEQFKLDNPNLKQKLVFPGSIGSISMDSGKLPEGFKDTLREMANKHPRANGIKHLI